MPPGATMLDSSDGNFWSEEESSEPLDPDEAAELILRADQQSYNPTQQTVTAAGDVLVQFGDAQLAAERLWINLDNRFLRAEGDVFFQS